MLTPITEEGREVLKRTVAEDIYNLCYKNNLYVDCTPCEYGVRISVNWGDWKHDHARLRWLLTENGYEYGGSVITEEDGSDCYSADHYVSVPTVA